MTGVYSYYLIQGELRAARQLAEEVLDWSTPRTTTTGRTTGRPSPRCACTRAIPAGARAPAPEREAVRSPAAAERSDQTWLMPFDTYVLVLAHLATVLWITGSPGAPTRRRTGPWPGQPRCRSPKARSAWPTPRAVWPGRTISAGITVPLPVRGGRGGDRRAPRLHVLGVRGRDPPRRRRARRSRRAGRRRRDRREVASRNSSARASSSLRADRGRPGAGRARSARARGGRVRGALAGLDRGDRIRTTRPERLACSPGRTWCRPRTHRAAGPGAGTRGAPGRRSLRAARCPRQHRLDPTPRPSRRSRRDGKVPARGQGYPELDEARVLLAVLPCRPNDYQPQVLVLGGGVAGLAAAWRLSEPGWRAKSPRSPSRAQLPARRQGGIGQGCDGRIEEHGLHVWLGHYDNAFRLIRDCYTELTGTGPTSVPDPQLGTGVHAGGPARTSLGAWRLGTVGGDVHPNRQFPGEPGADGRATSMVEMLLRSAAADPRLLRLASASVRATVPRVSLSTSPVPPRPSASRAALGAVASTVLAVSAQLLALAGLGARRLTGPPLYPSRVDCGRARRAGQPARAEAGQHHSCALTASTVDAIAPPAAPRAGGRDANGDVDRDSAGPERPKSSEA